mgnify:FL=1
MLDFYEIEKNITEKTRLDFCAYLTEKGIEEPSYCTDEPLDLDKYKADFAVFLDFASFSFDELSSDSQKTKLTLDVYFVRRNGESAKLKSSLLAITSAFYAWFYGKEEPCINRDFHGVVDFATISEVNFYDAVSGSTNIKIAQITIEAEVES